MDILPLGLQQTAWRFAAEKHSGQLYPGSDLPYIVHVGLVQLGLLPALEENSDLDVDLAVCCALLHDTIEDTETSPEELHAFFGPAITVGVQALSKNSALSKEEAMSDSLRRIRLEPREVWLVKLSDRIANLGVPPSHWSREKCQNYAAEGQRILDALGSASQRLSAKLASRIAAWQDGEYSRS